MVVVAVVVLNSSKSSGHSNDVAIRSVQMIDSPSKYSWTHGPLVSKAQWPSGGCATAMVGAGVGADVGALV